MASVNKTFLVGNVGKEPELRTTTSGISVCSFSLATTQKTKNGEDTQWHRVTFYDKLADIVSEFVRKGSQVYVEGSIKYGKYTDKNGIEKYTTDIIGREIQFLGGRKNEVAGDSKVKDEEFSDEIPF